MSNRLPWDATATDADADGDGGPPAGAQVGRRLIVAMLLTAAALDLTRCGLVLAVARHPAPAAGLVTAGLVTAGLVTAGLVTAGLVTAGLAAAGLVTAGLAAAALTVRTARGCQAGQRWAGWAALLIGATSAPQAAASGFRGPYTIPDTATAALGTLLAITILATAGGMRRDTTLKIPVSWTGEPHGDPECSLTCTSPRHVARRDRPCAALARAADPGMAWAPAGKLQPGERNARAGASSWPKVITISLPLA